MAEWVAVFFSLLTRMVSAGSLRTLWSEGALLEGVWVQAELQWPRRHQMGAIHRPLGHLRNTLLKFTGRHGGADHFSSHLPVKDFFSLSYSYFVFLVLPPIPRSSSHLPFSTMCWRLKLHPVWKKIWLNAQIYAKCESLYRIYLVVISKNL